QQHSAKACGLLRIRNVDKPLHRESAQPAKGIAIPASNSDRVHHSGTSSFLPYEVSLPSGTGAERQRGGGSEPLSASPSARSRHWSATARSSTTRWSRHWVPQRRTACRS